MSIEQDKEQIKLSNTRRKLIIATAATPFIATLKSGAAMAATSTINCIASDNSGAAYKKGSPDGYARVEANFYWDNDYGSDNRKMRNIFYIDDGVGPAGYYRQNGDVFTGDTSQLTSKGTRYVLNLFDGDSSLENVQYMGNAPRVSYNKNINPYQDSGNFPLNGSCLTSVQNSSRLL